MTDKEYEEMQIKKKKADKILEQIRTLKERVRYYSSVVSRIEDYKRDLIFDCKINNHETGNFEIELDRITVLNIAKAALNKWETKLQTQQKMFEYL